MSTTVAFRLNKSAHIFNAGESTGFAIKGGVKYYDRESKKDEWTNYETAVFAKSPAHIKYYTESLVEGAVITVTGKKEKIRSFQGKSDLLLSIELLEATIDYIAPPAARAPDAAVQVYAQAVTQKQVPAGFDDFDSDIPF